MNAKFRHAEAFCLMTYRSADGTEEEQLWNSRDGVTPFVIELRSGKMAQHVDWNRDRRIPDYVPPVGSRIFVDLTPERAREHAAVMVEEYWEHPETPMCDVYVSKEDAINELAKNQLETGGGGQPDTIEVTEEVRAQIQQRLAPLSDSRAVHVTTFEVERVNTESIDTVKIIFDGTGVVLTLTPDDVSKIFGFEAEIGKRKSFSAEIRCSEKASG